MASTTMESGEAAALARAGDRIEDRETFVQSGVATILMRLGVLVLALLSWEWISATFDVQFFLSRPTAIGSVLADWITSGYLTRHIGVTLQSMFYGFLLGAGSGIIAGFVLGLVPILARIFDPFIMAIYSLPKLALAPLFVLWFGIGMQMKVVLTGVIVFFFVFWNTFAGVRETDQELVDVLKVMGATRRDIIRKVILPGSLTYIYVGLKLAIPMSLVGAVVGELIASNRGLGYVLMSTAGQFNTAGVMAALFVLMVIATIMNGLLNRSEVHVMRWKRAGR
jgi:NitT/TauT family transport system permease protein